MVFSERTSYIFIKITQITKKCNYAVDRTVNELTQNLPGLPNLLKIYHSCLKLATVTQNLSDLPKTYQTYPEHTDEATLNLTCYLMPSHSHKTCLLILAVELKCMHIFDTFYFCRVDFKVDMVLISDCNSLLLISWNISLHSNSIVTWHLACPGTSRAPLVSSLLFK